MKNVWQVTLTVRERMRRKNKERRKQNKKRQEAFEKCWAHSPQRAATRRITIHQVSLARAALITALNTNQTYITKVI